MSGAGICSLPKAIRTGTRFDSGGWILNSAVKKVFEITEKFGTRDAFEIARRANVSVIYESWYPATFGEFERKTQVIRVNLRASECGISFEKIVAHELGHFFALNLKLNKNEEEIFARAFAENLTGNDK